MSDSDNSRQKLEVRDLASLVPFPTQDAVFPPCTPEVDASLAEDIAEHGLRMPIHVLGNNSAGYEPNTIIFGHRRRAALMSNGETKAKVVVRYDLAEATAKEIELLFIDDNDKRRQLSKLGKARVALRRYEIERRRSPGALLSAHEQDARDRVGHEIGMSGRHLQRYFNILKAPMSVQQAFENGQIKLVDAAKIAQLPSGVQSEIDSKLVEGVAATKVVKTFLGSTRSQKESSQTTVRKFLRTITKSLAGLDGVDMDSLHLTSTKDELKKLHAANKYLVKAIRAIKNRRVEKQKFIERVQRDQVD